MRVSLSTVQSRGFRRLAGTRTETIEADFKAKNERIVTSGLDGFAARSLHVHHATDRFERTYDSLKMFHIENLGSKNELSAAVVIQRCPNISNVGAHACDCLGHIGHHARPIL